MALYDRSYMGDGGRRFQWSITLWILAINAVCFLLSGIAARMGAVGFVNEYFALSADGIAQGKVWQLVTFQFLHGDFGHIILNSLAIFFVGRAVERTMSPEKYIFLYLFSGIIGGLVQVGWLMIVGSTATTVGASAGLFGLLAAFALILGHETISLMLFFILPISFQGRFLLPIGLILSILGMVGDRSNVGHASHLGGMVGALIYLKYLFKYDSPLGFLEGLRPGKSKGKIIQGTDFKKASSKIRKSMDKSGVGSGGVVSGGGNPVPQEEIDRILDKINARGIHSLTEDERKKLESRGADLKKQR